MIRLGTRPTPRPATLLAPVLAALLLTGLLSGPSGAGAAPASEPRAANPVTAGTVDTFPDPATIRAHDGRWYAYGTGNPIFASRGETGEHVLPILVSDDLTDWTYAGDAVAVDDQPEWWPEAARAWAPDIRYLDGRYHLTYSLSTGGIGLLTSRRPDGPWTDEGEILSNDNGCPTGTIDQALFTDEDGTHYLYWGSYDTLCVAPMNADGTAVDGPITEIGYGKRMEGAYVVRRGRHYYLFYSDGSCCDGAFSGYQVKVARATSPTGPFRTPSGGRLTDLTSHDGVVVSATGNGWIGPGHNSVATDLSGQDWLVYHAVPEDDPDFPALTGSNGATVRLTKRPMLIDRLDWIDGWPVVNRGRGPSASRLPQQPVTSAIPATTTRGALRGRPERPAYRLARRVVRGDVRIEASLRGRGAGLVVARSGRDQAVAWLSGRRLTTRVTTPGRTVTRSTSLPRGFRPDDWHAVVAERRGSQLTVEVSADRLQDAVGTVRLRLPERLRQGRVGFGSRVADVAARNVGAARLARPSAPRAPVPGVGAVRPAFSDEFGGAGDPASPWEWVRGETAEATRRGGSLVWPTQDGDLNRTSNDASVLLRDAPAGEFTVETKLDFDGTRGNQQAGLVLYDTDDRYLKLSHSVLPLSRTSEVLNVTEYLKEGPRPTYSEPTPVFAGPMFGAQAARTTWLRLRYRFDRAAGTHEATMSTSTDGRRWEQGGTWTLPRVDDRPLRIGLVSMNTPGATAAFDYVRTYRPR